MSSNRSVETVSAGAELQVGQPKEPLPQPIELALRDVVQAHTEVAFAYVPVIAFPGQPPGQVLVVFLRAAVDPEAILGPLSAAVKAAVDEAIAANPGLSVEPLAVLPISLAHALDALAQAVLITDTMLHVNDVRSWHGARNPKGPLRRALDWLMGR